MATFAVIDEASGEIVNRIVIDDPPAPEGFIIVNDTASPMAIGGSYVKGVYTAPPQQLKDEATTRPADDGAN
jgi:hypothetical protein